MVKSTSRKREIFNGKYQPGQFVQIGENCFDMLTGHAFVRAKKVFVRVLNEKVVSIDEVRRAV